jgi:transglutaminase-like putative cysteine protease
MNVRLAVVAAIAVLLASLSLSSVIASAGWVATGAGAVIIVAAAGIVTRLARLPSAVTITCLVLLAVVPLLTRPGWAGRVIGLVIVAVTALSATGARPLRVFAVLAGYLAGLLLYLNVTFAHGPSYGHLVPSSASITQLGQLWRAAFALFRYAPPVPDSQAVSLVTAAGIGAVAIVVDILAVRLRRPAVAGLPLLVLFSVPVASNYKLFGVPQMIVFAAGLAGYLALLSADGRQRLRMWGRLVTFRHVQSADETGSGPDTKELAASGRRIGLAAVCLAIVIPLVLPSARAHDIFGTTPDGAGSDGTAGVSPLLKVQSLLEGKPQPVLSYTTTAADPREQYFQVYALNYNSRQNKWLEAADYGDRTLKADLLPWKPQGVEATTSVTTVTTKVQVSKDDTGPADLPVPYAPYRLAVSGAGWQEAPGSLTVFSSRVSMPSLQYTVVSREADPKAADIRDLPPPGEIAQDYASYNGPDSAALLAIAEKHAGGATTQLQKALDLQRWFLSGAFTYSLKPDLPAGNWLMAFLTSDRRGFCSQFAQAFAILARQLGIPARIAIGYTGGSPGTGRTWQVTTADAHAWPELYFTGVGWLRFEPTPSGTRGQGTAAVPVYAGGAGGAAAPSLNNSPHSGPTSPALTTPAGRRRLGANRYEHGAVSGAASPGARAGGSDLGVAIGIPVVLFLLLAWPALTRILTRRRRWLTASGDMAAAHAAWRELTDDLADYGMPRAPGETPRATARRVVSAARLDEPAAGAVVRISTAEERARYATAPQPGSGLKADSALARRAIAASVPRRSRLRARLLPASTLLAARRIWQRFSEVSSWIDSSWPAVRRQLRTLAHR